MDDPIATAKDMSCKVGKIIIIIIINVKKIFLIKYNNWWKLTSLSFMANMIALACSAAFAPSGSTMTPINATGIFHAADAPCNTVDQTDRFISSRNALKKMVPKLR